MTIKIPEPTFADKALKIIGKKRGVIIPSAEYDKIGSYSYAIVKKESFIKALLRPTNKPLPSGMVNIYTFISPNDFSHKASNKEKMA